MAGNSTSSAPASSIDLPRAQPSPGNPCENPIQIPLHQTGSSKRRHREGRSGRGRIRRWRTWRKRPEPKNPTMKEREQHRSKKGSSTFVLRALFAFMETVARNMKSSETPGAIRSPTDGPDCSTLGISGAQFPPRKMMHGGRLNPS
ncbi:hypothetical protein BHE74_00005552 [Ensete ventricosum]|nr:hypothetical protein BHE74_00005552 [Ensete ventricosum]